MHNRNLKERPYTDVAADVLADLRDSIQIGLVAGIKKEQIITDPGIGFGKTLSDNLIVMKHLERLLELGYPVLLGTSRKSMIGLSLNLPVEERVEGTVATTVHDVKENYRALKMTEAILNAV